MGNIATTIEQQIKKLENRGMIIPDYEKANEYNFNKNVVSLYNKSAPLYILL